MGDPIGREGVLQGSHHSLLPDQIGKGCGSVFAGKDLVALLGRVGHLASQDSVRDAD
jgi:hypothetical protein